MPSDKKLTDEEVRLKTIGDSYEELYGFHDSDVEYAYQTLKGLVEK